MLSTRIHVNQACSGQKAVSFLVFDQESERFWTRSCQNRDVAGTVTRSADLVTTRLEVRELDLLSAVCRKYALPGLTDADFFQKSARITLSSRKLNANLRIKPGRSVDPWPRATGLLRRFRGSGCGIPLF